MGIMRRVTMDTRGSNVSLGGLRMSGEIQAAQTPEEVNNKQELIDIMAIAKPPEEEEEKEETESQKMNKIFDMFEFYRNEKEKMDRFVKQQEKILPEQYWRKDNVNLFETTSHEMCFEDQPYSEFNELCYLIKLTMVNKARQMAKDQDIAANTVMRRNGDTILHVCAEYG